MVRLSALIDYTNSFISFNEITDDEFVEYEVIEDADESGKYRYYYRRISFIKNNETVKGDEQFLSTFYRTREVVDLGTFDNWIHDVLSLNYQRFIVPYTDTERLMVIMRDMSLYMNLTKVAYLVRVLSPLVSLGEQHVR